MKAKRKYKAVTVSFSIPQDLSYAVDKISDAKDIPRSRVVQTALRHYFRYLKAQEEARK